jgi:hypothetical protein
MNITLFFTGATPCAEVVALTRKEIVGALVAMDIHGWLSFITFKISIFTHFSALLEKVPKTRPLF